MKKSPLWGMLALLTGYLLLKYFGGNFGAMVLYPVTLLVTFLHEFGHAAGAVLTGGALDSIQINSDGSGQAGTIGGVRAITLMGGYIGSAIFGNLLFYIGARRPKYAGIALAILAGSMAMIGLFWSNSLFTTGFLLAFAIGILILSRYTNWDQWIIMFLGMASIIYIIQDFNVGPSSDLQVYAEIFVVIPMQVWMYIWLGIVLILSFYNLRAIFNKPLS